ncbi:hypothetical protein DRE_00283 [Drechslerella stenobrocha 248]|uniref:Uncharacterized protein n=1 Tax=Drechslerella stenobrocha 248 TaxID=1043628 RepID=W7IA13_9PEZI|nr:hypothetical protein DRE_00283 [Drechslerella stenobrocha 248]
MHFSTAALVVAAAAASSASAQAVVTGSLGNAPVTTGNFGDKVVYRASFTGGNVGDVKMEFAGTPDGVGILVSACFKRINGSQPGPYPYHIHDFVVPENGNCTATGAHLDPYLRGDAIPCVPEAPETCQVGDLSGKHGDVPLAGRDEYCTSYVDKFLSLNPADNAFIGNSRSIVLHNVNKMRIACGNIVRVEGVTPTYPSYNGTTPPNNVTSTPTISPPIATGAASTLKAGMALSAVIGAAAFLLL